jgi:hypothetical protein
MQCFIKLCSHQLIIIFILTILANQKKETKMFHNIYDDKILFLDVSIICTTKSGLGQSGA